MTRSQHILAYLVPVSVMNVWKVRMLVAHRRVYVSMRMGRPVVRTEFVFVPVVIAMCMRVFVVEPIVLVFVFVALREM